MINCKDLFNKKIDCIKKKVDTYNAITGRNIELAIIQVGDNVSSNVYVKNKIKDCKEVGIIPTLYKYDDSISPEKILESVIRLGANDDCRGIIIPLPLPKQFTKEWQKKIFTAIPLDKDVDGLRIESPFIPCTPKGVLDILDEVMEQLEVNTLNGATVCVIGRSENVGKPLVNLLIDRGCTVVSCNSHTYNLDSWLKSCSIIISAVGKADFLSFDNFVDWKDKIVIDIGINKNREGKLCGDCSPELYQVVDFITPVPNGVGLMTRVSLLDNLTKFIPYPPEYSFEIQF